MQKLKGKILKQTYTTTGYKKVELYKNGIRKSMKVHRLVAIAFIPNPLNKPEINHKDGNQINNNVRNLEWCTQQENVVHAVKTGLKRCYKFNGRKLKDLYINKKMGTKKIAKIYGTSTTPIRKALKDYGINIKKTGRQDIYNLSKEKIENGIKNKSIRKFAKEIGCSPTLIIHYMKKFKIERGA